MKFLKSIYYRLEFGEVSERLIELVSKTSVRFTAYRGFESRPLRYFLIGQNNVHKFL